MDVSYTNIRNFIEYVIDWNDVISQDFSPARTALQKTITLSEIQETINAFSECNKKEIIDGCGDILVTAGFYLYLMNNQSTKFLNKIYEIDSVALKLHRQPDEITSDIYYDLEEHNHVSFFELQLLCAQVIDMYGHDLVFDYLDAILKSNDSKFTKAADFDYDSEMSRANTKYAGSFENITTVERMFRGEKVILIRADNGNGKLLKPIGFKEPESFMKEPI